MRIRERKSIPSNADVRQAENIKEMNKNSFPNIEAKPKVPVPKGGMLYGTGDSYIYARDLKRVAQFMGDTGDTLPLSVADMVTLIRSPFDTLSSSERRYRNRIRNRQTAIQAMCVVCRGTRKQVQECSDVQCPLWPFRTGKNPYRKTSKT